MLPKFLVAVQHLRWGALGTSGYLQAVLLLGPQHLDHLLHVDFVQEVVLFLDDPPMVVRHLQSMSNKSFNTAKRNTHGFIEPVVHYFAPEKQKDKFYNIAEKVEKTKQWLSSKLNSDHVDVINVPALEAESE